MIFNLVEVAVWIGLVRRVVILIHGAWVRNVKQTLAWALYEYLYSPRFKSAYIQKYTDQVLCAAVTPMIHVVRSMHIVSVYFKKKWHRAKVRMRLEATASHSLTCSTFFTF